MLILAWLWILHELLGDVWLLRTVRELNFEFTLSIAFFADVMAMMLSLRTRALGQHTLLHRKALIMLRAHFRRFVSRYGGGLPALASGGSASPISYPDSAAWNSFDHLSAIN